MITRATKGWFIFTAGFIALAYVAWLALDDNRPLTEETKREVRSEPDGIDSSQPLTVAVPATDEPTVATREPDLSMPELFSTPGRRDRHAIFKVESIGGETSRVESEAVDPNAETTIDIEFANDGF